MIVIIILLIEAIMKVWKISILLTQRNTPKTAIFEIEITQPKLIFY